MPVETSTNFPAVELRGVVKRYDKVEALRGVDLTVQQGERFALLGPNGAGKTTLFSILATLRAPTEGGARVLGLDVVTERDAVRRAMGIVFQEPAIEQRLSGRKTILNAVFLPIPGSLLKESTASSISLELNIIFS